MQISKKSIVKKNSKIYKKKFTEQIALIREGDSFIEKFEEIINGLKLSYICYRYDVISAFLLFIEKYIKFFLENKRKDIFKKNSDYEVNYDKTKEIYELHKNNIENKKCLGKIHISVADDIKNLSKRKYLEKMIMYEYTDIIKPILMNLNLNLEENNENYFKSKLKEIFNEYPYEKLKNTMYNNKIKKKIETFEMLKENYEEQKKIEESQIILIKKINELNRKLEKKYLLLY